MGIACDSNGCRHNDGRGFCELEDIFISEAETGEPTCQDAGYEEDSFQDVLIEYTPQQAKAKIEAWEAKKEINRELGLTSSQIQQIDRLYLEKCRNSTH